ncbi:TniB family NTP-binding protein [Chromobacterium phragmitis]|uniref:TniB family NTP-binding protein n=1 Tax=Chromobacterium phragmitis TaxID=2202141 RepID=A0ABV0IV87_9NEIS
MEQSSKEPRGSAVERVARLDKAIVRHTDLDHAIQGIQHAILQSSHYREAVGCMLLADGGMGKTLACKIVMASYKGGVVVEDGMEVTKRPAFYLEAPAPATVKAVAAMMLSKLGDPRPLLGSTPHMTERLIRLLKACGTQVIFLDEFHNLLKIGKRSISVNTEVCRWLRNIVNESGVTICLVGTPDCALIIDSDIQFSRRFKFKFHLRPLKPGTAEDKGSLQLFLEHICHEAVRRVELDHIPALGNQLESLKIYAATSGNPEFIMFLIKQALLIALREHRNSIVIDDFARAWDLGITATVSIARNNPFRMTKSQLSTVFRRLK